MADLAPDRTPRCRLGQSPALGSRHRRVAAAGGGSARTWRYQLDRQSHASLLYLALYGRYVLGYSPARGPCAWPTPRRSRSVSPTAGATNTCCRDCSAGRPRCSKSPCTSTRCRRRWCIGRRRGKGCGPSARSSGSGFIRREAARIGQRRSTTNRRRPDAPAMPTLSIVIPVQRRTVHRTLLSWCRLCLEPLGVTKEIIVVDDCSIEPARLPARRRGSRPSDARQRRERARRARRHRPGDRRLPDHPGRRSGTTRRTTCRWSRPSSTAVAMSSTAAATWGKAGTRTSRWPQPRGPKPEPGDAGLHRPLHHRYRHRAETVSADAAAVTRARNDGLRDGSRDHRQGPRSGLRIVEVPVRYFPRSKDEGRRSASATGSSARDLLEIPEWLNGCGSL